MLNSRICFLFESVGKYRVVPHIRNCAVVGGLTQGDQSIHVFYRPQNAVVIDGSWRQIAGLYVRTKKYRRNTGTCKRNRARIVPRDDE